MPKAKVGDIDIYYEVHGEGEPLVLIMGYGANSRWWFRQIVVFSPEFKVIAFDNRGTGQSDKPDVRYPMEAFADDAAGVLDAIGIDATHVYGVSMGGMIAQDFALRYPDRVISLILGATLCGGSHAVMPDVAANAILFDFERMSRLTPEEAAWESLPFLYSQEFIDKNAELIKQSIAEQAQNPTPLHSYRRQGQAMVGCDTYDRLPQIKAPTLVISGTADRIVPVENSRILASRIPNAELVLFEGAGHGYLLEVEDEANKAVLEFLERHRRSRQASI
jgi:pimeloyl-ACP methyl ester carboxylesterase